MKYLYFLVFFMSIPLFAQNRTEQKMRLIAAETGTLPLKVINTTTNEITTTDVAGYFKMQIQENDELVLVSNEFYQLKYKIKATDIGNNLLKIYPEPLTTLLQEVKVERVTSKSLGINAAEINKYIFKRNPNPNMDFKAIFLWLLGKFKKDKYEAFKHRSQTEMNPYVAALPRSEMTAYLKIPEHLVEKFYYYLSQDYVVDQYIKSGDEAKWCMYLLDKSFEFLEQEQQSQR